MRDVCDPEHDARLLERAQEAQLEEDKLKAAISIACEISRLEAKRSEAAKLIEQCAKEIDIARNNLRKMLK